MQFNIYRYFWLILGSAIFLQCPCLRRNFLSWCIDFLLQKITLLRFYVSIIKQFVCKFVLVVPVADSNHSMVRLSNVTKDMVQIFVYVCFVRENSEYPLQSECIFVGTDYVFSQTGTLCNLNFLRNHLVRGVEEKALRTSILTKKNNGIFFDPLNDVRIFF